MLVNLVLPSWTDGRTTPYRVCEVMERTMVHILRGPETAAIRAKIFLSRGWPHHHGSNTGCLKVDWLEKWLPNTFCLSARLILPHQPRI